VNKQMENDIDAEQRLMCQAHNCVNRWSVESGSGRLCSAHAWADPMDWGSVTRQEASKALVGHVSKTHEPMEPMSVEEKKYILERFKEVMQTTSKDHKAWAHRLRQREKDGDRMSDYQKKAWREALKVT
jgi:hypothetical protein